MPTPNSFTQDSFEGGMNLVSLGTKVAPNEYIAGINVRTRFGYAKPINSALDITEDLPVSSRAIQGIYAFGEILVVFVGGQAWYKDAGDADSEWTQIENFQLSDSVERIYAIGVPVASTTYLRKNAGSGSTSESPDAGIILDPANTYGTSQIALVCQDGINQPWLIFPDGTARISYTYDEWSTDNREYVPIGKQMVVFNNILFVVSASGDKIYRSVSGRPLDFVVAVNNNGEAVANAEVVSHAVDSNEIKLLTTLNSDNLIVVTAYSAFLVTPDYENLIYGEPRFRNTFLFTAGTINQFCWADLLGDFAFIDREGLKSFNAVLQTRNEGNNSVFSLSIAKIFDGIVQDENVCVGSFDNYTFFSVKTTYSPSSIVVYDAVKKVFCSIDLLSTQPIKQFATTYSSSRQRFFGCTSSKVYELYSPDSETPQTAVLFTRELDSRIADQGPTDGLYNIKAQAVRLVFEEGVEDGIVYLDEQVNGNRTTAENYSYDIEAASGGVTYPVIGPVMATLANNVVPVDFNKLVKVEGQKVGFIITWTGGAKLTYFIARCEIAKSPSSIQQQSKIYS
jgi:hypothetical protein